MALRLHCSCPQELPQALAAPPGLDGTHFGGAGAALPSQAGPSAGRTPRRAARCMSQALFCYACMEPRCLNGFECTSAKLDFCWCPACFTSFMPLEAARRRYRCPRCFCCPRCWEGGGVAQVLRLRKLEAGAAGAEGSSSSGFGLACARCDWNTLELPLPPTASAEAALASAAAWNTARGETSSPAETEVAALAAELRGSSYLLVDTLGGDDGAGGGVGTAPPALPPSRPEAASLPGRPLPTQPCTPAMSYRCRACALAGRAGVLASPAPSFLTPLMMSRPPKVAVDRPGVGTYWRKLNAVAALLPSAFLLPPGVVTPASTQLPPLPRPAAAARAIASLLRRLAAEAGNDTESLELPIVVVLVNALDVALSLTLGPVQDASSSGAVELGWGWEAAASAVPRAAAVTLAGFEGDYEAPGSDASEDMLDAVSAAHGAAVAGGGGSGRGDTVLLLRDRHAVALRARLKVPRTMLHSTHSPSSLTVVCTLTAALPSALLLERGATEAALAAVAARAGPAATAPAGTVLYTAPVAWEVAL